MFYSKVLHSKESNVKDSFVVTRGSGRLLFGSLPHRGNIVTAKVSKIHANSEWFQRKRVQQRIEIDPSVTIAADFMVQSLPRMHFSFYEFIPSMSHASFEEGITEHGHMSKNRRLLLGLINLVMLGAIKPVLPDEEGFTLQAFYAVNVPGYRKAVQSYNLIGLSDNRWRITQGFEKPGDGIILAA